MVQLLRVKTLDSSLWQYLFSVVYDSCLLLLGAASDILVLKLISVLVFILFSGQNFYFI